MKGKFNRHKIMGMLFHFILLHYDCVDIYLQSHWGLSNSLLRQIGSKLLAASPYMQTQKSNSGSSSQYDEDADDIDDDMIR